MKMGLDGMRHSVAVRVLVGGLGALAIVWAVFSFPLFWRHSSSEDVAKHIIAGDVFKAEVLSRSDQMFNGLGRNKWSRPSGLAAGAVIDLALLEQEIAKGDVRRIDGLMRDTNKMARRSLMDSPADPLLWTVLFWLENSQKGFSQQNTEFLKLSYVFGPNEGWVAIKRNRFALALYPALPSALAHDVVGEFSRLVASNYINVAVDIFCGPGWRMRDVLLSSLKNVDEGSRQAFARRLYGLGYNIQVPGIDRPGWRPWH